MDFLRAMLYPRKKKKMVSYFQDIQEKMDETGAHYTE